MLTRHTARFRAVAEAIDRWCREAGVVVHPGIVDALIRRRAALAGGATGVIAGTTLNYVDAQLGRLLAEDLIEADQVLQRR